MPKLTKPRWIWIVLADGRPLRTWDKDWTKMYHGQYAQGFPTYRIAQMVKRHKVRDCLDMMKRVQHDEQCVARWQATALSVTVIRIKLPEGVSLA